MDANVYFFLYCAEFLFYSPPLSMLQEKIYKQNVMHSRIFIIIARYIPASSQHSGGTDKFIDNEICWVMHSLQTGSIAVVSPKTALVQQKLTTGTSPQLL